MSPEAQKRVIILYADTGAGHRSVATAIQAALHAMAPEDHDKARSEWTHDAGVPSVECGLYNPVRHHPLGSMFDLYGPVTRRTPHLFAGAYTLSNSAHAFDLVGQIGFRLLRKRLLSLVEMAQPDLIVSVHSLLTQPMFKALRFARRDIPLYSVVTDLASIHQSWIAPVVDRCFAPNDEVRDEMIRRGMRKEQLRLSGLPIHPDYLPIPNNGDREGLRLELGLRPDLFTILVMGGGEGVGRLDTITRHLAEARLPVQLIVVAGHNPALYDALNRQRQKWQMPHTIFGFAHNVSMLMRASDVIVTKAGSVTIAESLACGLPIILSSVIRGQESGNVELIERNGVGSLARRPEDIVSAVRQLLALDEVGMRELRAHARKISTPLASFAIARDILAALDADQIDTQADAVYALTPMPVSIEMLLDSSHSMVVAPTTT